jgi:predicted amidophosphoribosyltransferase
VLAREIADVLGLQCCEPLARIRNTQSQTSLNRAGRRENVTGAFAVRIAPASPLLLVDDVFTTGATLEACAEALRGSGVTQILAVTVALAEPPVERTAA